MNKPFFSIVIPTYNRGALIGRCLDSILAQTYADWEVIVVDNFSEDNTEDIVSAYKDVRIRYIKNHNYGVIAVSRNKGIELSNGNWICFLDSDDCWYPNKLELLAKYTNDYDLIYHEYQTNAKRIRPFQRTQSKSYSVGGMTIAQVLRRGDPIIPSCAAVSHQALGDTRFSEDKELFAVEDYDFFLQLIDKSLKIKYLNKVLTYYDFSTGVSHGRIALDRDRKIYRKYMDRLTREEIREVIKYYYCRKAGYFYHSGTYKIAMKYFAITATAKDPYMKRKGIIRMIKSGILHSIDVLKTLF